MHRLYCPILNISSGKIIIDNREQVHHARDVLRLKANEEVVIFDDKGDEYNSLLEESFPDSMIFRIKGKRSFSAKASRVKITVACAIPKGSRMDGIIDKLTQLGADSIIPLLTERVIVKLDRRKKILRQERWKKIALNASQQSHRNRLPVIEPIRRIEEVLSDSAGFDLKLIPALTAQSKPLKEVLLQRNPGNMLVIIGPEGDFTPAELDSARRAGFIPVSLGELVLRVETAAAAITGFIRLFYENS